MHRTGRMIRAAVIAPLAAAITAGTAGAITPANGGDAAGTAVTISATPGDQLDPHVSADPAAYTDTNVFSNGQVHYYDFFTGVDRVVPESAFGDMGTLSDMSGTRISLARQNFLTGTDMLWCTT